MAAFRWVGVVLVFVLAPAACTADRGRVMIDLGGVAELAEYRDGAGAWQTAHFDAASATYELDVADDFEIVGVFLGPGTTFRARELAATRHESASWSLSAAGSWFASPRGDGTSSLSNPDTRSCNNWGPGILVTSQMVEPGELSISPSCASSRTPNWSFSVYAAPGTHDVIAETGALGTSSPPTAQVLRGVVVDAATSLPAIDPVISGTPLTTIALNVTGLADFDHVVTLTSLATATDTGLIAGALVDPPIAQPMLVPVLPASDLLASDRQLLEVSAIESGRSARMELTGADLTLDFPPAPELMFSQLADTDFVRWYYALSPRYEAIGLGLESLDGSDSSQEVYATRGWIAARDAVGLEFDTSAPGYKTAWWRDPDYEYKEIFIAFDYSTQIHYEAITYP